MRSISHIVISSLLLSTAIVISQQASPSFYHRINEYIKIHKIEDKENQTQYQYIDTAESIHKSHLSPFEYHPGDWTKYIIEPRYKYSLVAPALSNDEEVYDILSYGSMNLNIRYGKSFFTDSKYKRFDEDEPTSALIQSGFSPEQTMQLSVEGKAGKRLTLYINHDSQQKDNTYIMQYRAVEDDEIIREINAGDITIKVNNSKYAVYDDTSSKGVGIDFTIKKGSLSLKGFGSVAKGISEIERFKGNFSSSAISLQEYQYTKATYYQLEPFKRFDNLDLPPSDVYNTIAWTSSPANPSAYTPYAVIIDSAGFELYADLADTENKSGLIAVQNSSQTATLGYFKKLHIGSDFSINFSTGTITLLRHVRPQSKLFAVYTLRGGSTQSSDPSAVINHPQFPNKICVFIKFATSIHEDSNYNGVFEPGEDANNDGVLNYDMYELRGVYATGLNNLRADDVKISFFDNVFPLAASSIVKLGDFSLDYNSGIILFKLREPFKPLLPAYAHRIIYVESQGQQTFTASRFKIGISGYSQSRGFQLKHFNIIPDTVRVRINSIEISRSLYTVDPTSGFFQFINANNPVITPETDIEISYQYLPFDGQAQQFIGGVRADYEINKNINVGGTVLYTTRGMASTIPFVGNEPTQTTIVEADSSIKLSQHDISSFASNVLKADVTIPVSFHGYAEYAKSYHSTNTFGEGLIDDFESVFSGLSLSMSEKDWILSSLPATISQTERGRILYKFYRDISNPQTLYGLHFVPISIPYSKKPGPYNVAAGPIPETIQSQSSQRSLALDFSFDTDDNYISIVTRTLPALPTDLSNLQYVEFWYRGADGSGTVDLLFDIGTISEDSDNDGIFDTEDVNKNNFLDYDLNKYYSEDIGYAFNNPYPTVVGSGPGLSSITIGDGVLNTEDLNDNGMLDTWENFLRLSSAPIECSNTTWQKARIYVQTPAQYEEVLKKVYSVRLLLRKNSANAGTILIDTIRFVTMHWRVGSIDGVSGGDTDRVTLTLIDSFNDAEYALESFARVKRDVYTDLYGDKTSKELLQTMESALQVTYAGINSSTIVRRFHRPMDLRYYRTVHCWINVRSFTPNDTLIFRLHSSDYDYIEYSYSPQFIKTWENIILSLNGSNSNAQFIKKEGNPDLKRITAISVIVNNENAITTGEFWMNDMYASDPLTLQDTAHWYESTIKVTQPLAHTTAGMPLFSNISLSYLQKGHGNNFYTIGQPYNDIAEAVNQAILKCSILPYWHTTLDIQQEHSKTDSMNEKVIPSKRGTTQIDQFHFASTLAPPGRTIPQVNVQYTYEHISNEQFYKQAMNTFEFDTSKTTHHTAIGLQQSFNKLFGGDFSYRFLLDASFKEDIYKEHSTPLISGTNTQKKQRQSGSLHLTYQFPHFYITPAVTIGSEEFITYQGAVSDVDSSLYHEISSEYYVPFFYSDSIRFIERLKRCSLKLGLQRYAFLNPAVTFDFSIFENQFKDLQFSDIWIDYGFHRSRSTQGFLSNTLSLPINLQSVFPSIKSCTFAYTRSAAFNEVNTPYEGESINFYEEKYGVRRLWLSTAHQIYNVMLYPPWHFFSGRSNYANSRDFVTSTLSTQPSIDGMPFSDYNNHFRLLDNASFSINWELSPFILFLNSSINSVSERNGVNIPAHQVVTKTVIASLSCDLMKIFSFGFFRPNRPDLPHHSSIFLFQYQVNRYLRITSNILQDEHTPSISTTFKWDRSSIAARFGISYHTQKWHEFIPLDDDDRSSKDDIYFSAMTQQSPFTNIDKGYTFSTIYETDVQFIYAFFSKWYALSALPIFRVEYLMTLNRYNYTFFTSPEPYDLYSLSSSLTINIHKNIQGACIARGIVERFRNRHTNDINREIISYELGFQFSLLF